MIGVHDQFLQTKSGMVSGALHNRAGISSEGAYAPLSICSGVLEYIPASSQYPGPVQAGRVTRAQAQKAGYVEAETLVAFHPWGRGRHTQFWWWQRLFRGSRTRRGRPTMPMPSMPPTSARPA